MVVVPVVVVVVIVVVVVVVAFTCETQLQAHWLRGDPGVKGSTQRGSLIDSLTSSTKGRFAVH